MADPKEVSNEVGVCACCGSMASQKCGNCKQVFYCKKECQKKNWLSGHNDLCKPFQVKTDLFLGRHLIATRNIKAGDVILKEDPLVIGPSQITEPVCLGCYKRVNGNYRCVGCNWPLCGPICEKSSDHQPECVVGQQIGSPIDIGNFNDTNHFYELVTPLRCLTLKKKSPKKYQRLLALDSHEEERKYTDIHHENQKKIVQMLRNYFFIHEFAKEDIDYSERSIHRITGILDVNAVEINLSETSITGLYSTFSMLEHSCVPNVKYSFNEKRQIIAKAAIDIKKDDHLAIMYTHTLWGTIARREFLKLNKYFLCQCRRCADGTELNTNLSSLRCLSCPMGLLMPAAPLDELADWVCDTCNVTVPVNKIQDIVFELGDKAEKILMGSPSSQDLESFIDKYSSTVVHENHFHLFAIKHTLLQIYGKDGDNNDEVMLKKEKLCQNFLKICTTLDPAMCRLVSYTSVALFEYHMAILARTKKDTAMVDTTKRDLETARRLLHQCVKMLKDEPNYQPEAELRKIAEQHLKELNVMLLDA